ncbi:putative DNA internalization-related competence protein ComEC/Rec2 [Candidatus Sulfotelmatomonas gaucii]|uniref:Putative DNA internalization-related competence protein ComEC/Rec2 n=1 Tax=Candidatus Sulfuritelmatomonas gaucii TaxID=2043161 RepID=A0A2N9LA96_9BACT|nr:putative DNA internalization-related competence protein ComEC/Rec2 [Candidatus Sulfotelmatomonas gaucii]
MQSDPANPEQPAAGLTAVPLFHAAWLFAIGIALTSRIWLKPTFLLLALAVVGGLCILVALRAQRIAWVAMAALWLMLGAWCGEMEPRPAPATDLATLSDGLLRTVEGTVVDAGPMRSELEQNVDEPSATMYSQRIDLRVSSVEVVNDESDAQESAAGGVRLTVRWPADASGNDAVHPFGCGERVRAVVRILQPETYHDPGVWSRADYLLDQGITSTATVDLDRVERLEGSRASGQQSIACRVHGWQHATTARLLGLPAAMAKLPTPLRLSEDDAVMLAAMVAGDRTYLTHSLRVGFERTGSFHMLVVSGFHLAIVAACIFWITRRLRLPRVPATLLTIAASFAYAVFTGFATPVQRSLWMVTLYMLGRIVYRERSPMNTIGFAALCLLVVSPRSVFDSGLQMTLLAVIAIAGVAAPLLAMTLPMAADFHRITIFALPVNFLILPLLAVLMPAALLTLLALVVWPAAAVFPAMVVALVLHTGVQLVHFFGSMTLGDFRIPGPLLWQSLAFCGLLGLTIALAHASAGRGDRWLRRGACAALVLAALAAVMPRAVDRPHGAILMEAIDVGQGDSLLVITPDGKTLLVDGGGFGGGPRQAPHPTDEDLSAGTPAPQDFDIGEEVVSPALWARGICHLDAVALSHAHSDHMGGLPAVLRNFHPDELWIGNNPHVAAYNALLAEAKSMHVKVRTFRAGDGFAFGGTQVNVLAPFQDYQPGAEPANDDSLVLRVAYGQTSVLLEGDAEEPIEQAMLTEPGLASTLLKIGHHGSITSTRPEFLARVAPQWAVISCGLHNRYGHPRQEVLEELQEAHVRTFRTDINGVTCFRLDGVSAQAEMGCQTPP